VSVPVTASDIAGNLEGSVEYSSASLRVRYLFPGAVCRATADTGIGTNTPLLIPQRLYRIQARRKIRRNESGDGTD
jgi:hypothetical protein